MSGSQLNLFDLAPGKVLLERFKIVNPHRQGGMSAAFEVEPVDGGERQELQVFLGNLFEGREQAAEFAERLEAWKSLSSPAVVCPRELILLDDGSLVYVSDFPAGKSLREILSGGPLDVASALTLAESLLEGLQEVHENGLVHGDIKPEVIYYDRQAGGGSLVDGGITPGMWAAKHLGTRTALIGTPYYAPLEQFTGDSPDAISDLYNVATVLYEVLTGVLPWSGKSYIEVFQSKMMKSPPPMRDRAPDCDVPPEVERAIAKGLMGARKDRYLSVEDFQAALGALQGS